MAESVLNFIMKFAELGLVYYLVHSISSQTIKDFQISFDTTGFHVNVSFYEK